MNVFKLRAECLTDTLPLVTALSATSRGSVKISIHPVYADCEVEFETENSLDTVRDLIRTIEDGHVMLRTVQPIDRYTGE